MGCAYPIPRRSLDDIVWIMCVEDEAMYEITVYKEGKTATTEYSTEDIRRKEM